MKNQRHSFCQAVAVLSALGGIVIFATPAHSDITYVDANISTNTALDGTGEIIIGTDITQSVDGKWSTRPRTAVNGGTVLVAAGTEDAAPRLATTITLPAAGIYNIYGYFWINNNGVPTAGNGNWDAAFQLGSGGTMTSYSARLANATNLSGVTVNTHFTNTSPVVAVIDGGQNLFQASLGTWNTATDGLTLTVYIDDAQITEGTYTDRRTWYDGIGFELVSQPPAASFVLTIAPNGANYDFTWNSQIGKTYDLVTSIDLSTAPVTWPVWDGKSGIAGTGEAITLTNIPGDGPKRFFSVLEK